MGGGGVGKSTLVIRFVMGKYLNIYDPTVEDSYQVMKIVDGNPVLFDLLDTAGQEEFASMQDAWITEGDAFILVYRTITMQSFEELRVLRKKILRVKDTDDARQVPMVLVGNMCDLKNKRKVERSQAEELANEWNIPFYETSAKEEINNEEIFFAVCREYIRIKTGGDVFGYEELIEEAHGRPWKQYTIFSVLLCVYICLCGCIFHAIYVLFKRLYDNGWCLLIGNKCSVCISASHISCTTCQCKRKKKDSYFNIKDDIEAREKRNQLKLLFKKVEFIEEDQVREPILSLKNFRIKRKFAWKRFIKAILCGLCLPLVLIFQTFVFLSYSEGKEMCFYGFCYPLTYAYDHIHKSLLLDLLGLIIGRKANQDPDCIKQRNWFLRQSRKQKVKRVFITILFCLTYLSAFYNIYVVQRMNRDPNMRRLRISLMESIGPFVLYWMVWLLLSCWIAYGSQLKPRMPNTYRLRSIKLYLGENFSHMTDAHKFLRAYAWTRNKKLRLTTVRLLMIILLGLLYGCIPGITRYSVGDDSDGLWRKKFITKYEWKVEVGALLANAVLISTFVYAIEVQYSKHFDNYREWMYDLTMLLNKTKKNKHNKNEDEHYVPEKGRNFSKDIFLSLTRKSNGLGWLEIRSFLAAEGKLLFAEQELPTLCILLLSISSSLFILYRIMFIQGKPYQSILFNGATMLCVVCLVSLIRIAMTGYQFEQIQKKQERLLGEQRFFMRCSNKGNDNAVNTSHNEPGAPKLMKNPSLAPLSVSFTEQIIKYKPHHIQRLIPESAVSYESQELPQIPPTVPEISIPPTNVFDGEEPSVSIHKPETNEYYLETNVKLGENEIDNEQKMDHKSNDDEDGVETKGAMSMAFEINDNEDIEETMLNDEDGGGTQELVESYEEHSFEEKGKKILGMNAIQRKQHTEEQMITFAFSDGAKQPQKRSFSQFSEGPKKTNVVNDENMLFPIVEMSNDANNIGSMMAFGGRNASLLSLPTQKSISVAKFDDENAVSQNNKLEEETKEESMSRGITAVTIDNILNVNDFRQRNISLPIQKSISVAKKFNELSFNIDILEEEKKENEEESMRRKITDISVGVLGDLGERNVSLPATFDNESVLYSQNAMNNMEKLEEEEEEDEEKKSESDRTLSEIEIKKYESLSQKEINESEDEYEEKEMEMKPLLMNKSKSVKMDNNMIRDIHNNIIGIGNISNTIDLNVSVMSDIVKSDRFGFIDNMLFIVQTKNIYPRLFHVKVNSVLPKAIIGVIISVVVAAVKLLF